MKKRLISLLAVVLMFNSLTACSSISLSGNKDVKYKIDGDHAVVTELPTSTGITEIIIADEYEGLPVTEIRDFAGCNLEYAEKITIGKNVSEIGVWAFTNNQKLKEFIVSEENESFTSRDGVLFTKDMKTILFYPCGGEKEYKIPDTVETIRSKAFYKCGGLEKIEMPSSLRSVEEKAFFRCSEMQDFEMPQQVEEIAKDAFGYCTSLTQIDIPSPIKTIGEYAFYNCTALLSVTVNAKEENITLGKDWQPTNNGLVIDELVVTFK